MEENKLNIEKVMVKYLCDYCGGWVRMEPGLENVPAITMSLTDFPSDPVTDRKICIKCLIKTFDLVLGKPEGK